MNSTVPALRYFTWWAILRASRCRACRTLSSSPYAGASSTTCHKLLCYCDVGAKTMSCMMLHIWLSCASWGHWCSCHQSNGKITSRAGQGRAGQGGAEYAGQGHSQGVQVQSRHGRNKGKQRHNRASNDVTHCLNADTIHYIKPVGLLTLRHDALSCEDSNHTIPDSKA